MRIRTNAVRLAVVPLAVGLVGVPPIGGATAATPDPRTVKVSFSRVATGLVQPVGITGPVDGSGRVFVIERRGTIRFYRAGVLSGTYLDIRSRVHDAGGEQGLLGLAFHPSFKTNGYFFVAYTTSSGALRVARYKAINPAASTAGSTAEVGILEVPHPGPTNHNGGQLAFNKDGYLYISTGDGGGAGDPNGNAQNRRSHLGKILRIDVNRRCGGSNYCSPSTNPYYGHPTYRDAIWAYGLRNPWRFSFDRSNGNAYIGDVGQARIEELDFIPYGEGGRNFGWSCYEGTLRYSGGTCPTGARYTFPFHQYGRTSGGTVIGGYVYRGGAYPALQGIYVYGDFVSGRVWGYRSKVNSQLGTFPTGQYSLVTFGESGGRELWAAGYDGSLYRVVGSYR